MKNYLPQCHRDTKNFIFNSASRETLLYFNKTLCLFVSVVSIFLFSLAVPAQSTNQSFPTAVTANEISGTIKARDLGDARLTSYFYVFNGNQGDIFINVVTKNLDGDIDVFTADNLRPLTKIRVYSDNPEGETGRVIYLRQPQKLILRIEGKTPTDEPATFRIKFAGSFQAMTGTNEPDEKDPEVASREESDVRVNSVGTIIEVKPKPKPTPKPSTAKVETEDSKKPDEKRETETVVTRTAEKEAPEPEKEDRKPEVVVTDDLPDKKDEKRDEKVAEKETPEENNPSTERQVKPKKPRTTRTDKKAEIEPVSPSDLVNIRLIVEFKDGRKIERPMSEILKFGVDKGILTIIVKDGSIGRYSILDIAKITVE